MSSWMQSDDCVQRKTRQVSQPEWDYKRSLVSLVTQVGNQRQRRGGSPLRWRDIKLPTRLQTDMANYNDWVSDEGLKTGWLANWLITERVTGLGGSCIQLTQKWYDCPWLYRRKRISHTHTHTLKDSMWGHFTRRSFIRKFCTGEHFAQKEDFIKVMFLCEIALEPICGALLVNSNNDRWLKCNWII